MKKKIIKIIETEQKKSSFPPHRIGDLVKIKVWVSEGKKKRIQSFEGILIAKRNRGLNSSFTVRKNSNGEGVERVFQSFSPIIHSIKIKKKGNVRKAKLYYIRKKIGKSAKIKEKK